MVVEEGEAVSGSNGVDAALLGGGAVFREAGVAG